ncbi:MAG: TetR/AcrR family transcriptional regulator [Bacilli bacterium]|jgi:AcrR family transcriptional regulator|nr:TetR/AcrR family transcriptional regulator [Bacilli bacterium]
MSRRPIPNIDEKIIQATIEIAGGTMRVNRFSMREVAERAGCSEFVIFSHFKTKARLIAATNAYSLQDITKRFERAIAKYHDIEDVFVEILDEAVAYPSATEFAVNYAHIFPRTEAVAEYKDFRVRMKGLVKVIVSAFPLKKEYDNDLDSYLMACHLLRECATAGKALIHHEVDNTPEIKRAIARNALYGLSAYKKNHNERAAG